VPRRVAAPIDNVSPWWYNPRGLFWNRFHDSAVVTGTVNTRPEMEPVPSVPITEVFFPG